MSSHRKAEKQFLLKDQLFNEVKVKRLASELKGVYPDFPERQFVKSALKSFPDLELKERIVHLCDCLKKTLPAEYKTALNVILKALPPALSAENTDHDFGDFIYAPYGEYVAREGCRPENVEVSLLALEEITKRFSMELALRDFINKFPKETTRAIKKWMKSDNYHVRRLASEGTRPFLPWAKRLNCHPLTFLPILDQLYSDKTSYVVRSVANHLNDVSKVGREALFDTLRGWEKAGKVSEENMEYLKKQSLRTLLKAGDNTALALLGFGSSPDVTSKLKVETREVKIGDYLSFSVELQNKAKADLKLLLDYEIEFAKKESTVNGKSQKRRVKVFKIGEVTLESGEKKIFTKKHSFKLISTRTFYTGKHVLFVRGNGQVLADVEFVLHAE